MKKIQLDTLATGYIKYIVRADWLNHGRVFAWGSIFFVLEALFLGFLVLWHHDVFGKVDPPASTDFVSFYASGKLALAGTPALVYDHAAHAAAEIAATSPNTPYQFFFYPPVYLLLCAPLALLPYMVAFISFQAASLTAWIVVIRHILDVRSWAWCLPMLAYPAVFWTLGLGQNAFLTATLLGAATLLIDKRPVTTGLLLGLLCYKPHLALLVPVALAAGGRWRAFTAAAATVAAVVVLSFALFGADSWHAYLVTLSGARDVYENGDIDLAGLVTPYGAARVFGATPGMSWAVQAVATILTIVTVGWIWRYGRGPVEKFVALSAGILLSVPLALVYDLLLLTIAMAWLVRAGRLSGFRAWQKPVLFFCFLMPLISRDLGQHLHVGIAPLAPAALLCSSLTNTLRARTWFGSRHPGANSIVV